MLYASARFSSGQADACCDVESTAVWKSRTTFAKDSLLQTVRWAAGRFEAPDERRASEPRVDGAHQVPVLTAGSHA